MSDEKGRVRGRPTKYSRKIAKKIPELRKEGQSIAEVCCELGISRQTYYSWLEIHPDFKEAHEIGQLRCEAWWMRTGRLGACAAIKVNSPVWSLNMKNRFGWSDRPEETGSSEDELTPEEYARRVGLALAEMDRADGIVRDEHD